ncbi:hypothetical protein [Streptomyces roseochromogenus]|uniref:Uncharacterized protein n=1 Tax=Streptomyces roseochromogenus subsp. oscitans DS 12.976 TaxID=1352936 RepID=V6KXH4_STRRC|nr:hypothetical protein [Streptomyces roseochromogenus]EST36703.1 hypothetical protein M878_00995 [Streptomyces roseochromogenus subsp. oscitans DS 12.976]
MDQEQIDQGQGPDSGEVVDIAIDPSGTSDQVIYIACNDGGVWKSTDGGLTWKPKTDLMPSLSMGAVALDPGNPSTVYAGTGNPFDGGGQFTKGVGIYKSIDGGETWSVEGAAVFTHHSINRMVLPVSGVLLVGALNGVYRSVDGGLNFGANAPAFNDGRPVIQGYVTDLKLDTRSPTTTVYASISGQGVFVSTDAGATFPTNLFANPGAPAPGFFFISFAQSNQPDGATMYASVQGATDYGLYKSIDSGAHWVTMPAGATAAIPPPNSGYQLGYDQTVGIDPLDHNRVYLGFQELHLSTDGANTFRPTPISQNQIHWDHHALVFSPASHLPTVAPAPLFVGTDGGIHATRDGGATWSNLNEGIATNIFLGIGIGLGSTANNAYTYGGTQDTGTLGHRPEFPGADWHLGIDGDGGPVAVDPANPRRVYGSDDGTFISTSDGGSNWTYGATGIPAGVYRIAIDPNNSSHVYATVGSQLYQSTDTAGTFTQIATFPTQIRSIATTPLDSNTLWLGLEDGSVRYTSNALAGTSSAWNSYTPGAPSGLNAEAIAISPTNLYRVVVAFSGFSAISPTNRTKHLFQTTNNGATWSDISGTDGGDPTQNLPDLPLHAVVLDPGNPNGSPGVGLHHVRSNGAQLLSPGLDGTILTSPTGTNWAKQSTGTTTNLVDAAWDGHQWVVVGYPSILTSPDSITWTAQPSGVPPDNALEGIAWSGTLFVVINASTGNVLTSPDGQNWTIRPLGATTQALGGIAWDGAQFIGVGYGGTIVTSPDGMTWTARNSGTTALLVAIAVGSTVRVAVGDGGTILTSPDGVTWTSRASGVPDDEIDDIAWSGNQFAAVTNSGAVLTSPDGITWTRQTSGTNTRLLGITWDRGQFVAVGDFVILTSPDGVHWTPQSPGQDIPTMVVASDASVMQSLDGGASWHILGVDLPEVDCKSLALDSSVTPSLLRVGTYGRSVYELTSPSGPALAMNANLAFGAVPVGSNATLPLRCFNVGSTTLSVNTSGGTGNPHFAITPASNVSLNPGDEFDFSVTFKPPGTGHMTAKLHVRTTDPSQHVAFVFASGTGI